MTTDDRERVNETDSVDKLKMLEGILDESDQLIQMSYLDDMTMIMSSR